MCNYFKISLARICIAKIWQYLFIIFSTNILPMAYRTRFSTFAFDTPSRTKQKKKTAEK